MLHDERAKRALVGLRFYYFFFAAQLTMSHSFTSSLMKNSMFLWMKSVLILNPEYLLTQMQA